MSLSHSVLAFLARLKRGGASDPYDIERLESQVHASLEGAHVALMAPLAKETWEAQGTLLATDDESDLVKLQMPEPIEVLGYVCSVALVAAPAAGVLVVPGLADVMVSITVDRKEKITQAQQLTTGGDSQNFITLAALNLQPARMVGLKIQTPTPTLDFVFRWRAGANVWPSVLPNVAVIFRYCEKDGTPRL